MKKIKKLLHDYQHPLDDNIDELLLMYLNMSRPLANLLQLKEEKELKNLPEELRTIAHELYEQTHQINTSIFDLLNYLLPTQN